MGQTHIETGLQQIVLTLIKSRDEGGSTYSAAITAGVLDQNGNLMKTVGRDQFFSELPVARQQQVRDLLDVLDSVLAQRLEVAQVG